MVKGKWAETLKDKNGICKYDSFDIKMKENFKLQKEENKINWLVDKATEEEERLEGVFYIHGNFDKYYEEGDIIGEVKPN